MKPKKLVKKPLLKQKSAASVASKKAIKVAKPASRKKIAYSDTDDDLDFPDDDAEVAEMQICKAPPARARPARAAVAKKPTTYDLSSDDEDDESDAEFS
jgi:hypothetical protein